MHRRGGGRRPAPVGRDRAAPLTPALLLFDIDGTLLRGAAGAHRDAIHAALREVHGIADPAAARVETAGRTDGDIVRAILLALGVSAVRIDDRMADVREAACAAYARLAPQDLSATVAPGLSELLPELAARDDVLLSLVTGNLEPIARLKLRRAGIGAFFPRGQGGFGSDAEDRAALPAVARRRAGAGGRSHPRERTWVIGDTPRDVACARADGVRCIGVAGGPFGAHELEAAGADAVAPDATALRGLLARELR